MNLGTILKVITAVGGFAGTIGGAIAAGVPWHTAILLGLGNLATGAGALQMKPLGQPKP